MSPLSPASVDSDVNIVKAPVDIEVAQPALDSSTIDIATAGGAPVEKVEFLSFR
jgi:hypothetical protein